MATEHHFYLNATASRHELLDTLVRAGLGLEAQPDWKHVSVAFSPATDVTVRDHLSSRLVRLDNGVVATCSVTFRDRRRYIHDPGCDVETAWLEFETETVRGIVALLRGYPEADAYWEAYDDQIPMLLRRAGRLVLSQASARPGYFWDPERSPSRALVDLPYAVEPLGPWAEVDTGA